MREVSIAGSVAACLLALLRNVRPGGRCDGGVDALGGEFIEDCQGNDVPLKGGTWPAETDIVLEVQIVNADASVTTKLSFEEMDLP